MSEDAPVEIVVTRNGPYTVKGPISLTDPDGNHWDLPEGKNYALCRCSHSQKKPFCDGTHNQGGFESEPTPASQPWPWGR